MLLFYLIPLSVAAFLSTLGSASIGSLSGWGLPLQWKTGGCIESSLGLVCAAEYYNWLFFAFDALFYLLIAYSFLYVSHRFFPTMVERVVILKPRSILFVVLTASIVTVATGWLASGMFFSPGGFSGQSYGFPLAWKTTLATCPPPCIQANGTQYEWTFLAGDLLFYMTGGYGILLYTFRKPQETRLLRAHLESGRVLAIMALVLIALSAGNYAYDSVYGTGNHWTGYGNLALDHYSFQSANLLTVWLKNYGPGTVTLISLYIKNDNYSGTVASYQLNVAIDPSTVGMISENTTSQGLQLTQNSSYALQIVTSQNIEMTFSVTWT